MLLQTVLVKNKNISLKLVRFIFSSKLLILWLAVEPTEYEIDFYGRLYLRHF